MLDLQAYEARQKEYASKGYKHFYFMTLNGNEVLTATLLHLCLLSLNSFLSVRPVESTAMHMDVGILCHLLTLSHIIL